MGGTQTGGRPQTRLDRLLNLLSTGQTPSVRLTAAQQLGAIAGQRIQHGHQNEVDKTYRGTEGNWQEVAGLLHKLLPILKSKSNEARSAAAVAVHQVCRQVGVWDPSHAAADAEEAPAATNDGTNASSGVHPLRLADFNLRAIVATEPHLLGSSGTEYVQPQSAVHTDKAHKDILSDLGLGGPANANIDLDIKKELDDAQNGANGVGPASAAAATSAGEDVKPNVKSEPEPREEQEDDLSHLSARERNALKRKRKKEHIAAPQFKARKLDSPASPKKPASTTVSPGPEVNSSKQEPKADEEGPVVISHQPRPSAKVEPSDDPTESAEELLASHLWPFASVVTALEQDLTNPNWHIRHGAALGLAAVIELQGQNGGQELGLSTQDNAKLHDAWADHLACRFLTLLALDRFGDYVGDTVLAPVREAASTGLAKLLDVMSDEARELVRKALVWMVTQEGLPPPQKGGKPIVWQVRHSGLLGLRFLVSTFVARSQPLGVEPLRELVSVSLMALQDNDDDVKSAAAAALLPVVQQVVQSTPDLIALLIEVLWICLSDLKDDLSSSVANIMALLSDMISHLAVTTHLRSQPSGRNLADVPPLLYPYFRHTISSVRMSVVNTIALLTSLQSSAASSASPLADSRLFRLLLQNLILEHSPDILAASQTTFFTLIDLFAPQAGLICQLTQPDMQNWVTLVATPIGQPLSTAAMYRPTSSSGEVDAAALRQDMTLLDEDHVLRGRIAALSVLAEMLSYWPEEVLSQYIHATVVPALGSTSYFKSFCAASLISDCLKAFAARDCVAPTSATQPCAETIPPLLETTSSPVYDELAPHFRAISQDTDTLMKAQHKGGKAATKSKRETANEALSRALEQKDLAKLASKLDQLSKSEFCVSQEVNERATKIIVSTHRYRGKAESLDTRVSAARAGALVALGVIPPKLNPVIKGLMNSLKTETSSELQERAGAHLASFIALCSAPGAAVKVNPSDKIIKNLCSFLCQDTQDTPLFDKSKTSTRPIWAHVDGLEEDGEFESTQVTQKGKTAVLTRRGAEMALQALSKKFGDQLLQQQPKVKSCMRDALASTFSGGVETADAKLAASDQVGQDCVDSFTVLPVIVKSLDPALLPGVAELLPFLFTAVRSTFAVIRSSAARCLALVCEAIPVTALHAIVRDLLPLLGDMAVLENRRGVIEVISNLVKSLDTTLLPFILFFLVPTLGRTTDPDPPIRSLATLTFAKLVRLVPLEAGFPDPPDFPSTLLARRDEERKFLSQLLNGTKAELYEIPVTINAELRKYQREGVSWLAFLSKYNLHGILCDDMGLGKTLQTICILASVMHDRKRQYESSQSPEFAHRPSLVICPPTLVSHWAAEIEQYAPSLRVQQLIGNLSKNERASKVRRSKAVDVFVTSYELLRNDINELASVNWTYCILDEGHIIKNPKTRMAQAVKRISAAHRLILSGTPVQNHVLELWSLFDFLMPGFLGTEKAFNERFSKPIKASRDAKTSSKEQAAGTLALESLHKQVLPFVLRRLKEDVLDDLPPKIIQDYYCDLSTLQKALYEQQTTDTDETSPHVFQTLQYMRKLVNHPLLVMDAKNEEHQAVTRQLKLKDAKDLHDIQHAPKLEALQQILTDCGIGIKTEEGGSAPADSLADEAVAPHRVLVFCQMRQMLDLIEEDLFRAHMPDVTYMRLDGTVAATKRQAVVQTFNSDPSIDVLLLTTSVGGLGLTLTGADTVIFVEHDWNPMKDLQAMDRAHRLGQKRVVNVYRLITRGTLEEKIMGLQKFKLNIASSVVNEQNTTMGSMETDQVLDLFDAPSASAPGAGGGGKTGKSKGQKQMSRKALLEGLGELEEFS